MVAGLGLYPEKVTGDVVVVAVEEGKEEVLLTDEILTKELKVGVAVVVERDMVVVVVAVGMVIETGVDIAIVEYCGGRRGGGLNFTFINSSSSSSNHASSSSSICRGSRLYRVCTTIFPAAPLLEQWYDYGRFSAENHQYLQVTFGPTCVFLFMQQLQFLEDSNIVHNLQSRHEILHNIVG